MSMPAHLYIEIRQHKGRMTAPSGIRLTPQRQKWKANHILYSSYLRTASLRSYEYLPENSCLRIAVQTLNLTLLSTPKNIVLSYSCSRNICLGTAVKVSYACPWNNGFAPPAVGIPRQIYTASRRVDPSTI